MTWHYQIVRKKIPGQEDQYAIHDAFCNEKGEIWAVTDEPKRVMGESPEVVKETLQRMLKDAEKHGVFNFEGPYAKEPKRPRYLVARKQKRTKLRKDDLDKQKH